MDLMKEESKITRGNKFAREIFNEDMESIEK